MRWCMDTLQSFAQLTNVSKLLRHQSMLGRYCCDPCSVKLFCPSGCADRCGWIASKTTWRLTQNRTCCYKRVTGAWQWCRPCCQSLRWNACLSATQICARGCSDKRLSKHTTSPTCTFTKLALLRI